MTMLSSSEDERETVKRISDRLAKRGLFSYVHRVSKDHHVLPDEMLGASRRAPIVKARQALWRALHDEAGLSWPMVGEIFEKKHDSIVHATSYKETRARANIEHGVINAIARYVRGLGYGVLASEIQSGAWRPLPSSQPAPVPVKKCLVPSCPHDAREELAGRCHEHRQAKR